MRLRPLTLILFLLLPLLGLAVRPLYAHANLLQSNPEMNATLERPPIQVELFFSEAIENGFSTIEVLDSNGKRVDNGDSEVDLADPSRLTVSLRSMPDGVYSVSWRALSSVDSHITAGAFPFAVGEVSTDALQAAGTASNQFKLAPGEIVARWLTYLSAMILVGGIFFLLLVWQPACEITGLTETIRPPWKRLANLALLVLVGSGILWLFVQAGQVVGQELVWPWDPSLGQVLFATRFGALWIARLALAMILFWLIPRIRTGWLRWVALAAGLLLLLTISLGSHAAAQSDPLFPVLADWVHLISASVWVGGLISFVVGLASTRKLDSNQRTRITAELIPRFSALALISVGLLALTGLYASILHVGSVEALLDTIYGRTLLVKLIIIIPMLLLGAINFLLTSPGMRRAVSDNGEGGQVSRFRRLVSSEVVLGVAVLLSVSVLTTLPPAQFVSTAPKLVDSQEVDDLDISIEVIPGRPGLNKFVVKVGADSRTVNDIKEVSLQFTPVSGDLPPVKSQLTEIGDGRYRIEGGFLALPDVWQIQVAVRRENAFDTFANFDLNVGSTPNPDVVQTFPWYQLSALTLLISGTVGLLLSARQVIQGKTEPIYFGLGPGVILFVTGMYVLVSAPGAQNAALVNPIPPNIESLASGEELYKENCVPCHGVSGAGDGPIGRTLNPPPADLTLHTVPGGHPDSRLYDWITNGFPDSVMPVFNEHLTDEERWHLVNYIRTLSQP